MALSYKKDLDKYKDLDEDEILNKLSAEELKQLETALEEMDPEVRTQWGLGSLVGGSSCGKRIHWTISHVKIREFMYLMHSWKLVRSLHFISLKGHLTYLTH